LEGSLEGSLGEFKGSLGIVEESLGSDLKVPLLRGI